MPEYFFSMLMLSQVEIAQKLSTFSAYFKNKKSFFKSQNKNGSYQQVRFIAHKVGTTLAVIKDQ
jgi:hypothetical protein